MTQRLLHEVMCKRHRLLCANCTESRVGFAQPGACAFCRGAVACATMDKQMTSPPEQL